MEVRSRTVEKPQASNSDTFLQDVCVENKGGLPSYTDSTQPVQKTHNSDKNAIEDMQYTIEDTPPWYLCILLGFQHYLTMLGATVAMPLSYTGAMCVGDDDLAKSEILSTIFFVSGLVTLLQTSFGSRLPIVQGGTFAFLSPILAILSLPKWQCPDTENPVEGNMTTMSPNVTFPGDTDNHTEVWQSRMREIQGAIIVASLFQVMIGLSGVIGYMLKFIGPLAIAPTISLIGISLFESASNFCKGQWWIALMTMMLVMLFSQYLRNIGIPCGKGRSFPLFKLFPVIIAILLSWFICAILTVSGALPDNSDEWGYLARVDTKAGVLKEAKWIRLPYPGQWGLPTVSLAGVFGMLAGVLAGMIESIGDYYAAARLSGAPPPPTHAINRGITVEGLGCVLAGLWGSGTGTTSYSENVGAIGITKVGSRRVIQVGGLIMVGLAVLGKFGALFVTIPDPIIGGVFMVMFGMITAVGLSNLQYVDLNSSRNLFIFGFAIFFGLSLSQYVYHNPDSINTGDDIVDQIITVLLSTSMFVGGSVGFILDNTIPGTDEERGITEWRRHLTADASKETLEAEKCYDFPIGMGLVRRFEFNKYIPICPTFEGWCTGKKKSPSEKQNLDIGEAEEDEVPTIQIIQPIVAEQPAQEDRDTAL